MQKTMRKITKKQLENITVAATLRLRFTNLINSLLIIYIVLQTICPSILNLIFGHVF